jgi:hypothetical protein
MKLIYTSCLFIFLSVGVSAQNYTRDAGIRFGQGFIGSYRQFYKEDMAIDLYGGFLNRGLIFGGLKENFRPALTRYSDNFRLYFGYGVHAGFNYTNSYKFLNRQYHYDWTLSPLFGMDGIVGLEYYFPEVPVLVAFDVKPYFEFSLNRIFELSIFDVTFSVKYRF